MGMAKPQQHLGNRYGNDKGKLLLTATFYPGNYHIGKLYCLHPYIPNENQTYQIASEIGEYQQSYCQQV